MNDVILEADLPQKLREYIGGKTQERVAQETGERQSEISKALRGQNNACARRLIQHYGRVRLKPAYEVVQDD